MEKVWGNLGALPKPPYARSAMESKLSRMVRQLYFVKLVSVIALDERVLQRLNY